LTRAGVEHVGRDAGLEAVVAATSFLLSAEGGRHPG